MSKNLVIVESPAKAKTIEGFLGKDFIVKSSMGHIRDLEKKDISIDVDNEYKPKYITIPEKKQLIKELKELADSSEIVWLATDEDREGEAISWHLFECLGLKVDQTKRIVFHEITKKAIQTAIQNPRSINEDLVNAQQARRVLDRLVGFELSPVLWKKVKPSLSAGRVQSVAVRLIVDREREIDNFEKESFYKINADFVKTTGEKLKSELNFRPKELKESEELMNKALSSSFHVSNIEVKPSKRNPAAPFTTSTLQQEASRKLGFSVNQTMTLAQKLYESGQITYMRTDSVSLSNEAIQHAQNVIVSEFGQEYSNPKKYQTKSKNAQEAHEAIRPTDFTKSSGGKDAREQKLYELIWKRTLASQMASAILEKTVVQISDEENKLVFISRGEVIKFDGFLKLYIESHDDDEEEENSSLLPKVELNEALNMENLCGSERFTHHMPRFSEASLVKRLEENGIGRPSTYAPTISTVQKRGYVVKQDKEGVEREYDFLIAENGKVILTKKSEITGKERGKLCPTDIGIVVNDFLVENFDQILDYSFTAGIEEKFDDIAEGKLVWNKMISDFYMPFHSNVTDVMENSEKAKGERLLGIDPNSGRNVYVRIGKFGPMAQIGESEEFNTENPPKFASLLPGQQMNAVSLEEVLTLFKLPRNLGDFEGSDIIIGIGKYGPYIRHNNKFVSLNDSDPYTIKSDEAISLISIKREEDAKKVIAEFGENKEIKVLNGKYGPYINHLKKNYRIPKQTDPFKLDHDACMEIINSKPEKSSKKPAKKSPATKKKKSKTS